MANASRDGNRATVILGTSSVDGVTPTPPYVDPVTHRLLVDASTGGVTSVSNVDGSLTISPTTGAVVASLNTANPNTWSGFQTFNDSTIVLKGAGTGTTTITYSNTGTSGGSFIFPATGVVNTIATLQQANIFTNATSTYGNSTATSTYGIGTGATLNGSSKTINIGTGGVVGSTTAITLGSTNGTTTTVNGTLTVGSTISASNLTGTNTGDQTNISGNAATVTTNANLTGVVTSVGNATSLGSFTSAQLATALTDETGSGANVFGTNPTIVKPVLNATNPTAQSYSPAAAGTATLDLSLANQHDIIMPAGNITIALSNDTNNQIFSVSILQDGTGSRTVTWFATIRWAGGVAPTLTTTASKRDRFVFVRTGSGTYDGLIAGQNI